MLLASSSGATVANVPVEGMKISHLMAAANDIGLIETTSSHYACWKF